MGRGDGETIRNARFDRLVPGRPLSGNEEIGIDWDLLTLWPFEFIHKEG